MSELFDDSRGELLSLPDYVADFRSRRQAPDGPSEAWKIERRQFFSDPGDPPWVAFSQGRWDESIRLMERARPSYEDYYREARSHGVSLYRVRVVEVPVRPYVQWEFHYLRIAVDAGEMIRVVTADEVREAERCAPLPEIISTDADIVYKVLYDPDGVPVGARRVVDAEFAGRCTALIKRLYEIGEDFTSFFTRQIAPLAPPPLG